jgi:hypothetical protein
LCKIDLGNNSSNFFFVIHFSNWVGSVVAYICDANLSPWISVLSFIFYLEFDLYIHFVQIFFPKN